MASDAKTNGNAPKVRANPLDILGKEGCKVQSLTVSDQHSTLLVSHPVLVDDNDAAATSDDDGDNKDQPPASTSTTIVSSLLKLTLVPFHKSLLGSNPVLSPEDIQRGQLPERNLLEHNPNASDEIISFLRGFNFELKSESGAEYSYYAARPTLGICALGNGAGRVGGGGGEKSPNATAEKDNESSTINTAVSNFGSFDIELISPASTYQIARSMPSLGHVLIRETPHLYTTAVKPYIQSIVDNGSLSWIKNVIEVRKEKERLLLNHDKFVMNVDTKWRNHPPPLTTPRKQWYNHPSTVDLYCLGIVKQSDITCLRDLRKEHVPLLKTMEKEGLRAIQTIYGIGEDQIRVFVHYQPQFYHFHVHFTRLENEVGCAVERGHLLSDVIQNLEFDEDYYCKRIITYKLKKGSPLQNLIESYSKDEEEAMVDAE